MNQYSTPPPDDAPDRPYVAAASEPISAAQVDTIVHCLQTLDWPPARVQAWLQEHWGVPRVKLLSQEQATGVITALVAALAAWAEADVADADFAALSPILDPTAPITQAQVAELDRLRQGAGMNDPHWRNWLLKHWKVERVRSLNQGQYQAAWQLLQQRQSLSKPREQGQVRS
jgi:hypothetical protein